MTDRSLSQVLDDIDKKDMDIVELDTYLVRCVKALRYAKDIGWNTEKIKSILEGKTDE